MKVVLDFTGMNAWQAKIALIQALVQIQQEENKGLMTLERIKQILEEWVNKWKPRKEVARWQS